ncbi:alkanesulfonate transport domain protein, partial [Acinetobacter baumannii 1406589]
MSKDINIVSRGTKQVGQRLLPWIFPIVLLVVWQIASSSGLLENRILPAPTAVVSAFWHLLISGELWQHVKVSAGRALLGLFIGGGLGLLLGLLNGSSRFAS